MIPRYTDHAANERTFLAWVRTALAVMAFGFLVEKFDLFLQIASATLTSRRFSTGGHVLGDTVGLVLVVLGGTMMLVSTFRYRQTRMAIDAKDIQSGHARGGELLMIGILIFLGVILFSYLSYTVLIT